MKIDLTQVLKNIDGRDLQEPVAKDKTIPLILQAVVSLALRTALPGCAKIAYFRIA